MAVIIAISLILLWKLEFAATLMNLKALPASVPQELSDLMDAEKLGRTRRYLTAGAKFSIVKSIAVLMVFFAFWFTGGFRWLDETSRALLPGDIPAGLGFITALMLAQWLISLPFAIYDTFVIENRFGFNRTTPATFATDQVKALALGALIGLPLLAAILWIFHHIPHAWLWAWLVTTAFQLLLTWLAPSLIMPLFNKFSPMPDGPLKQAIEKLGARCGFPLDGVFIMDGSKRSTKANAFFTGFGKRKKIALFDTLIEKSTEAELLAVLAHEIGHFRRGHIRQRLAVGIIQTAIVFFLIGLATDPRSPFARALADAFGIAEISPHTGLVLFMILMEPVGKLLAVLANAWSRKHEFEADAYAREMTGNGRPLATALKKMTVDHLSHPTPGRLRVWLDYSHPPLLERIRALGP